MKYKYLIRVYKDHFGTKPYNMKKISSIIFICFSVLFFASCKKDSGSGTNYYMKATIDGTEKTYSSTPLALSVNQSGTYILSMSASASAGSSEGLGLQITQSSGPIAAGTYTDGASGVSYLLSGVYNPGTVNSSDIYGAGIQLSATSPLTITITNVSTSAVSGTFSGEFFDNSGAGTNSIMITDGSFNLPIQ